MKFYRTFDTLFWYNLSIYSVHYGTVKISGLKLRAFRNSS